MQNLSLIIPFLLFLFGVQTSDSPHGPGFKENCIDCHTADGWEFVQSEATFDHNTTKFPLKGQHQITDCRACHVSLVFAEAKKECAECHNDVHQQSVRLDCSRCHTPQSWLVSNVTDIHQVSRFPLMGPHKTATCSDCHKSGNPVQFEPMGIQCIDCHSTQYYATSSPNHVVSGFSTDCNSCHNIQSFEWGGDGFNHSFFPLTGGHDNINCFTCHQGQPYNQLSADCYGCHSDDYTGTNNPNHTALGFGTNCASCHNINGWQPANFDHDGPYFPIYSGEHEGEWNSCTDCHTNPSNYAVFSCTGCHSKGETDGEHDDVGGYSYNSEACLHCHPDGSGDGAFNHSSSGFPLTGAHVSAPCLECHANGYAGTTKVCENCHMPDYNGSLNPNHQAINIPTGCATCHTTAPGWAPATFPIHNNYYALNGKHATIANNCATCHNGNYNTTPNTCVGCHQTQYNQTTNPSHSALQFSTACQTCHTENSWTPSTFNHDAQYFPIYSGNHQGEWNNCIDCHTNPSNYAIFSCIDCHEHNNQTQMNSEHSGVSGYQYNSIACLQCHPNGSAAGAFNHNTSPFPLTGGHAGVACINCHANGYAGTTQVCQDCHMPAYNTASNPGHQALGLATTCATCHTTAPGWAPASFPVHNSFYVIAGAHTSIANSCATCHNGNYTSTPNTCVGCHQAQYNQTTNPSHVSLQFSTDCQSCHTQTAWTPSTFNHDQQYFRIYSGDHNGEWDNCTDCHTNPSNYTIFSCLGCHEHNQNDMDDEHSGVSGYSYNSNACLNCHHWVEPKQPGGKSVRKLKK